MLKLYRQYSANSRLPRALKAALGNPQCKDCAANAQLPRVPMLALPPEATPNISVSLDVMPHNINNKLMNILVILDDGDMMLRLKLLPDASALSAFHAYYSRWIAYFDAPVFTIVDRGSNLCNDLMASELRKLQSQLCPIATEAPWSLGSNERSHSFLHKAIDKLLYDPDYNPGLHLEKLLGDVEVAWNFAQHTNNVLPHYHRFGLMPRIIGELTDPHSIRQRVSLMETAREYTEQARAAEVIRQAHNPAKRQVLQLRLFSVHQRVWYYRKKHGWLVGTVVRIDRPTIYVSDGTRQYPTHECRVRPHFGDISLPPDVLNDDPDTHEFLQKPRDSEAPELPVAPHAASAQREVDGTQLRDTPPAAGEESQDSYNRAPISELLNGIFIVTEHESPVQQTLTFSDTAMALQTFTSSQLDDLPVFLTATEHIKNVSLLSEEQQERFRKAKEEEIRFLLQKAVKPVPQCDLAPTCELQPLKWILAIKRSSTPGHTERYRARLVSASHRSQYRHRVHGNAPTVALSTVRALYAITPTWQAASPKDPIEVFTRDVTKAYLQSKPTQRLIYYEPPSEFFDLFPKQADRVWQAIVQLYGDVEAGLYWNKTFVPWLTKNILDLQQSIYDPSLLYSPTRNAAILLCTDDTNNVLPRSALPAESTITQRFECRDRQQLPTDFKGLDIMQEDGKMILSQNAYLDTISIDDNGSLATKPEVTRMMTSEELSTHRKTAGKLAWVATGTSPLSAFAASVALQGPEKPVSLLLTTHKALIDAKTQHLAKLTYVPLDPGSTHIRLYSDGSYQNLHKKHSQIGFLISLSDKSDRFNVVHWHSSRAPRRAHSTEEAELMALDIAFRHMRNFRRIIFQLLKKEVPVVAYIDNDALWGNLMNETVPSLPEVMYRCREYIHDATITSMCLIPGTENPADSMTKAKPNHRLSLSMRTNVCRTMVKRVFMLQTSPYRNVDYIPTSRVPMPSDH